MLAFMKVAINLKVFMLGLQGVRHCTDMPEGHTAEMSDQRVGKLRVKLDGFKKQLVRGIDLANALA